MINNTFKILSIDGGGIKGIHSCVVICELEKAYGPVHKKFNLLTGTSTGGIIALGLAIGKTAKEILQFYIECGPEIFPSRNWLQRKFNSFNQLFISSKYSGRKLKSVLENFFGEAVMEQAICNVCIPATNLVNSHGIIFKTPHDDSFNRDHKLKLVDVAIATTAVPTFFPSASITGISNYLVDGGLWANNPSFIGAVEAVSYFVGKGKEYDTFNILSISNLSSHNAWYPPKPRRSSVINWRDHLFNLTISAQSNAMNNLLKIASEKNLFPLGKYIRIEEPHINPNQAKYVTLDRADKAAVKVLMDLGQATSHKWVHSNEIINFMNN